MQLPVDINSAMSVADAENHSLRDDLIRCEVEAKQLNTQLDSMKLDYGQLIHDRDREIVLVTDQLDEVSFNACWGNRL